MLFDNCQNGEAITRILRLSRNGELAFTLVMLKIFFNYVIAELEYYDNVRKSTGKMYQLGPADYVFYGDNVAPDELKQQFQKVAVSLEKRSNYLKDWQPGSHRQILNLVDPYIYCFRY